MNAELLSPNCLSEDERLEGMLVRRLGNRIRHMRVLRMSTGIVLQGHVGSYHLKQLAQHAAMELSSDPIVANEIEVG